MSNLGAVQQEVEIVDAYYQWRGLDLLPDNIPDALRYSDQWLLWKARPRKNGNGMDKVPYQVNGNPAKVNDPNTWTDFETAVSAYREGDDIDGIGFVLTEHDQFYGLDFDHVVDGTTGKIKADIQRHIESLNTYVELSPSGTGIRAIAYGEFPKLKNDSGNFEAYDKSRFLTITGHTLNGSAVNLVDSKIVERVHVDMTGFVSLDEIKPTGKQSVSDDEIFQIKSALAYVDSDKREIWLSVGMALHSTGNIQAFELWDTWSKKSDKYDADDSIRVWKSIKDGAISLGTLFYYARQNGWARLHTGESFALTDMGNAERLVNSCGGDLHYCTELKTWLIWNGRYWEMNNDGGINRIAKGVVRNIHHEALQTSNDILRKAIGAHAYKSESKERVKAMIQMAATESGIPTSILNLDNASMLLNAANGVVDLRTGEIRPHDKADLMTGLLPFKYESRETSPRWEKFLLDVFNGDTELIKYIQRAVGYTLTGKVSEQVMFFLYGKGSNGKSTFLNVLSYLLGRHSVRISSQILMQKPDNNTLAAMAGLRSSRCVITSEVEEGQRMTESLVKDLTGGDKIAARKLYCDYIEFTPTHKLWQYGNHKPQIRGTDDGIWRRISLIPFTQSFKGKDKVQDMDNLLMQEIEGILAWSVQGCLMWQKEGLGMPEAVKLAVAEYREAEDVIAHFLEDCTEKECLHSTKISETYMTYRNWADDNGYKPLAKKRFKEQMIEHGIFHEHKETGDYWIGLRVKPLVKY